MYLNESIMSCQIEITNRFEDELNSLDWVGADLAQVLTLRRTRLYRIDGFERRETLQSFVEEVLLDPISEQYYVDAAPALDKYDFYVDLFIKPGVLDLESKAVLDVCRRGEGVLASVESLKRLDRFYVSVSDETSQTVSSDEVLQEIANPVIHEWEVSS